MKIIDFGIAKAAGKGSKTQAGILKGKFGYMSPEQVRGLPIDRRSDVFSCGIVLYELLTGERLFVGESDFSTLEKVRNVEILPPSTYNRKIPDELERIVLKALAKDVEDRYQNAIDLHDELQAFVYTAGEFYSRKDLAGWMKKTFGKEIEEETAKLEAIASSSRPPRSRRRAPRPRTRSPVSREQAAGDAGRLGPDPQDRQLAGDQAAAAAAHLRCDAGRQMPKVSREEAGPRPKRRVGRPRVGRRRARDPDLRQPRGRSEAHGGHAGPRHGEPKSTLPVATSTPVADDAGTRPVAAPAGCGLRSVERRERECPSGL